MEQNAEIQARLGGVGVRACGVKSRGMRWVSVRELMSLCEFVWDILGAFSWMQCPTVIMSKTLAARFDLWTLKVHKFSPFRTYILFEPKTQLFLKSCVLGSAKHIFLSTFLFMRVLGFKKSKQTHTYIAMPWSKLDYTKVRKRNTVHLTWIRWWSQSKCFICISW